MTAIQAVGDVFQGVMNRKAARRQSTILQKDAAIAELLGSIESDQITREGQREVGAAVARAGASGFTIGSSAALIADLAGQYGEQARYARYDAGRRATRMRNDAAGKRLEGTMHVITGVSNAAGRIIDAGAKAASAASGGGGG